MFFIYADNLKHNKWAIGVLTLIVLQTLLFLLTTAINASSESTVMGLEFVPLQFSLHPLRSAYTLVSAPFLHLNIWHLAGNVMFFLAFGRTLETLLGTPLFLAAYLFIGALAFLGSWMLNPDSTIPIIGSSGAIAFLMGVYLVIFPKAKLRMIFIIPPFFKRFLLPAYVFLFLWIALQLFDVFADSGERDGVAYATHALGFLIGMCCGMAWKELAADTDRQIELLTDESHHV